MIKVLINGSPIYKLCFTRKKYKTIKRKNLTASQIIAAIKGTNHYVEGDWEATNELVADSIRQAFESKPLYETTALVFLIDAKRGEPPVATASTRQSRLDDNSRNTGREVALGRLLRTNNNPPFSEIERKAIRKAYDNRAQVKPIKPPSNAGSTPASQLREANSHPVVSRIISFPTPYRYPLVAKRVN